MKKKYCILLIIIGIIGTIDTIGTTGTIVTKNAITIKKRTPLGVLFLLCFNSQIMYRGPRVSRL